MSFRWKKAAKGSSRFSQMVADHLHSPRVETGFPTSLIDLFVKNRDRMRKFPNRKGNRNPNSNPPAAGVPDPIIPTSSPPLNPPNCEFPTISPTGSASDCGIIDEIDEGCNPVPIVSSVNVGDYVIPNVSRADAGGANTGVVGLFISVLKVCLVVCLALGTKRFVIGITLSAFGLFFLELIGKNLYRICSRSSDSICKLESIVPSSDGINSGLRIQSDSVNVCSDCPDHSGEIQIVKMESCSEQILCSEVSLNASDFDEILVCEEDLDSKAGLEKEVSFEVSFGVPELKRQCSRREKMKSKMKKLVPKNLRKLKKTSSSLKREESGSLQSDTCEEQEQCNNMVLDCQGEEQEQCNIMVLDCREEQQVLCTEFHGNGHTIGSSGESSLGELEAIAKVEEVERPIQKGSGYLGLCLIVLFGLVGGRIVALVLALSWCMMLKILARRSRKVPMVRSLAKISN